MANIVPFESAALPAHLKAAAKSANSDLTSHSGLGFSVMSIKGKTFTLKKGTEKKLIMNPNDPRSPATYLEVVLVKVNPDKSKVYYEGGWVEGSDAKPDCFSNNGKTPDPAVKKPVCGACGACPKNQIGSRIGDGGVKLKACSDSVRIAVAAPDRISEPFLIRVPAASIKNLGELGRTLDARGVTYQMVVTELSFDSEAATPKLQFKPVGFLDEAQYAEVLETAESEVVKLILGTNEFEGQPEEPTVTTTAETVIAKAKQVAETVAQPAKTVTVAEVNSAVDAAEGKEAVAPKPLQVALENIGWDD